MNTDSITSTALTSRIDGELRRRQEVGQVQQQIALLSARMIAERVRAKHPDVAAFGLNYTDNDGDYRVPGGYYATATAADEAVEDDELDDVLYEYCGDLDDGNAAATLNARRQPVPAGEQAAAGGIGVEDGLAVAAASVSMPNSISQLLAGQNPTAGPRTAPQPPQTRTTTAQTGRE